MKIEFFDLYDRLSKGELIWPFGDFLYAIVVTNNNINASISFNNKDEFAEKLIIAKRMLGK